MNSTLVITETLPSSLPVSCTSEAVEARNAIITKASKIATVTTPEASAYATESLREINSWLRRVEDDRAAVKRPFLQYGRGIDDVAEMLTNTLEMEKRRLDGLLGTYEAAQRAVREKIEAERRAEEARLDYELRRKIDDMEAEGIGGDELRHATHQATASFVAAVNDVRLAAAEASGKQKGVAVRKVWKYEVTDIHALMQGAAECVELKPHNGMIMAKLKCGQSLPGVRAWQEVAAVVRV